MRHLDTIVGCQNDKECLLFGLMDIMRAIGKQIAIERIKHEPELSAEALAHKAGVSRQTLSAIENGKKPKAALITILSIADALGVKITDLIPSYQDSLGNMLIAEPRQKYGKEVSSHQHDKRRASTGSGVAHHKRRAG